MSVLNKDNSVSRRKSMQLVLGVTAFGLALGKKAVAGQASGQEEYYKIKLDSLNPTEKSTFSKLSKNEQSLFIKLTAKERSSYSKLAGKVEKSEFLKLNAD